ncbi:MAG: DUF72 domain-containing protein [Treponema sp.]|nr:DUF72 domain-containing protein [Treponema sp.]
MIDILIGTSGYSYKEWVGPVYPEGTKQKDYLACYAGLFPTVELNFSYYRMPDAQNLAKMLLDAGPGLTFSIKAHRSLTHEVDSGQWEAEAKTYIKAIEPMLEAGRLEAVLFQFPYSFHYTTENRRYLGELLDYFKGIPSAVEFRGADWCIGKVIDGMKSRGVPLVSLDMPDLKGLPPTMDVVTAPVAYIRLHGRNKEAWWGKDEHARYDYLYTDSEVEAIAGRIERVTEQAQRILVYFNNHPFGKAVRNAQTLRKLLIKLGILKAEGKEVQDGGADSLPS